MDSLPFKWFQYCSPLLPMSSKDADMQTCRIHVKSLPNFDLHCPRGHAALEADEMTRAYIHTDQCNLVPEASDHGVEYISKR